MEANLTIPGGCLQGTLTAEDPPILAIGPDGHTFSYHPLSWAEPGPPPLDRIIVPQSAPALIRILARYVEPGRTWFGLVVPSWSGDGQGNWYVARTQGVHWFGPDPKPKGVMNPDRYTHIPVMPALRSVPSGGDPMTQLAYVLVYLSRMERCKQGTGADNQPSWSEVNQWEKREDVPPWRVETR